MVRKYTAQFRKDTTHHILTQTLPSSNPAFSSSYGACDVVLHRRPMATHPMESPNQNSPIPRATSPQQEMHFAGGKLLAEQCNKPDPRCETTMWPLCVDSGPTERIRGLSQGSGHLYPWTQPSLLIENSWVTPGCDRTLRIESRGGCSKTGAIIIGNWR